jgi:N-methylhydantoinase A
MAWSVLALTLGGSSLLYLLIQRGAATTVTSLMYLVPPSTAVMAWLLFGEPITLVIVAGVVLTAAGALMIVATASDHDATDYVIALVLFGAGPLLAGRVARALEAREVVIPPHPGLLCAVGLLVADLSRVFSETRKLPLTADGWREGREVLARLEAKGREWHRRAGLDGAPLSLDRAVDMRYAGQNHEIAVGIPDPASATPGPLREAFEDRHRRLYRFALDRPADFVTWRVTASLSPPAYRVAEWRSGGDGARATGRVYIAGEWHDAAIVERERLAAGDRLAGPAVVQQMDSTVLVLPGDEAEVDRYGNLHIRARR